MSTRVLTELCHGILLQVARNDYTANKTDIDIFLYAPRVRSSDAEPTSI